MLRKKICEQIQTYLFGEDGAQQRIEGLDGGPPEAGDQDP